MSYILNEQKTSKKIENDKNGKIELDIQTPVLPYLMQIPTYFMDTAIVVMSASSIYILWILLHFIASHVYIDHCVGSSWKDIFISVFYVSSPYCQGVSWLIYNGSRQIACIWVIFGTYFSTQLLQHLLSKPAIVVP